MIKLPVLFGGIKNLTGDRIAVVYPIRPFKMPVRKLNSFGRLAIVGIIVKKGYGIFISFNNPGKSGKIGKDKAKSLVRFNDKSYMMGELLRTVLREPRGEIPLGYSTYY